MHILEPDCSELKDSSARRRSFVALHETVGRTLCTSTIGRCCHAKPIYGPFKRHRVQVLALTHCCHAKSIHGACKRHTVQISLHRLVKSIAVVLHNHTLGWQDLSHAK